MNQNTLKIKLTNAIKNLTNPLHNAPVSEVLGNIVLATGVEIIEGDTVYTDGKKIYVGKDFIKQLEVPELSFIIAHEALHIMQGHALWQRKFNLNPQRWNIAGDLWINRFLDEVARTEGTIRPPKTKDGKHIGIGWEEPKQWGLPEDFPEYHKTTEMHIYRSLPKNPGGGGCNGGGSGSGQGNLPDDLRPDPNTTPEELKELEEAQERAKSRAKQVREIQKSRGTETGDLLEIIDQLLYPKVDWRKLLENALVTSLKDSYRGNWVKPRPTGWFFGYVSPGEFNEGRTNILISIDTSGSISQEELQYYYGAIKQLIENYDEEIGKVWLIQHDFEITHREEIDVSQEEELPEKIEIHGRGGTSHKWLPKVVEEIEDEEDEIGLIILLTDAESDLEKLNWPEIPTVILTTGKENLDLPPQVQIIPLLSP